MVGNAGWRLHRIVELQTRVRGGFEPLIESESRILLGPRYAVVLVELRCPAAVADFVFLSWIIQPCPEASEAKPQCWPHVIMDKHLTYRHGLRQVEDVLHVSLFFMCLPRALRYNAGAGSAYGRILDVRQRK